MQKKNTSNSDKYRNITFQNKSKRTTKTILNLHYTTIVTCFLSFLIHQAIPVFKQISSN